MEIMTEKVLRIPLNEIHVLRFLCRREGCGGVLEIPVDRLESLTNKLACQSCGHELAIKDVGTVRGLRAFGLAWKNLANGDGFGTELVVVET
jgi:hypothetical protein